VNKVDMADKRDADSPENEREGGFHQRLMEVLGTQKKAWWNRKLGVSNSLIASRWEKGGVPKADKIIRICQLAGVSANWLLLGVGPKYIDSDTTNRDEDHRRDIQEYIIHLEKQKSDFDQVMARFSEKEKALRSWVQIARLLDIDSVAFQFERLEELPGDVFFQEHILPLCQFFRSLSDIAFKSAEFLSRSEDGKLFIIKAIKWLKREHEKDLLLFRGRLKELEVLFEDNEREAP